VNYRKSMLALLIVGGLALATAPLARAAPASAFICIDDGCGGDGGGDGGGGGGGTGGGGGGGGSSGPTACSSGYIATTPVTDNWIDTGVANVNDVAAGPDGSVWYITGTPGTTGTTVRVSGGSTEVINQGGKRIAVDAQGNPWIVDFNGNIWHLVNGSFQELPTGLARDIAVAPSGLVWVIGTNSRNGSFQVWSWNGSSWTANAGSGEEIDVAANGDPVVNGADGKVWIMDGGANSGWSQVDSGGLSVFDMGLSPCSPAGQASVGASAMWFTGPIGFGGTSNAPLVFSDGGGVQGPYSTTGSGPIVEQFLNGFFQVTASHVAVDTGGRVWIVADPAGCDCAGELLERPFS
jgi:hypothetical protein